MSDACNGRGTEDGQNLHTLQTDEGALVVECCPTVAIGQLIDAEHASNEDDKERQADENHEELEPCIDTAAGDLASFNVLAVAECVLD